MEYNVFVDVVQRRPDKNSSEKPSQNIQDAFLNTVRREKLTVTIYLVSGVKLMGRIKSFDKYSVLLETSTQEQLIFKHAISTVVTQKTHHAHPAPVSSATQDQPEPQAETTEV